MSDRPRRALADDEEPEEIPEVRFVEESAIPARRAAGSENVSDQPTPHACLLYTSPSPRDRQKSRMPSSA